MISVVTTAFNHQDTLQRTIDNVRCQKGVELEHIVLDDTNYRMGMMRNFQLGFNLAIGEYIAVSDGDDWYCDPTKLRRQLAYMESHPDCGLCITKVYTDKGHGLKSMHISADTINERMSFDALLCGSAAIHAQSFLLRRSDFDKYIDFDKFVRMGFNTWDLGIVLELIRHKKIHCLDFHSAVFTVKEESVTHTRSRIKRLKYVLGTFKIKLYFIFKYGCKLSTIFYLSYVFARSMYSIIFARWYK